MRVSVFIAALGLGAAAVASAGFAQDVQLPEGPAREKIQEACTACHSITEVTSNPRAKAQWAETVDTMISRGAQVSDADYPLIVDYLSQHFAPKAAGAAAPAAH